MQRDRLVPLVLALLAVVALGAAAATLDTTTGGGTGSGSAEGAATGPGEGEFSFGAPPLNSSVEGSPVFEGILRLVFAALFVVGLLALLYALYDNPKDTLVIVLVATVAVGAILVLIYQVFSRLEGGQRGLLGQDEPTLPGGGAGDAATGTITTAIEQPGLLLVVLLGLVVVVAGVVLVRATGDDSGSEPTVPEPAAPESSLGAVGDAAGRAADSIESTSSVENAVYRAWVEMTDHLDVDNPRASTPGEFERAAVAAGMDREDVRELTALFEATRYGGAEVTERRADRAVEALRRIERAYGGDER